jgi:hypothetical protein
MRRLRFVLLLSCLNLGCGSFFVGGAFLTSTVRGNDSLVQLSSVTGGDGNMVSVTFVTFLQSGPSTTIGFCGDQRTQFPMDQVVQANFNPGETCASIITVIIII